MEIREVVYCKDYLELMKKIRKDRKRREIIKQSDRNKNEVDIYKEEWGRQAERGMRYTARRGLWYDRQKEKTNGGRKEKRQT